MCSVQELLKSHPEEQCAAIEEMSERWSGVSNKQLQRLSFDPLWFFIIKKNTVSVRNIARSPIH